ncbi:hypothetical protein CCH79_00015889 [Gambusia affinis]|uniref:Uncharacterized protein n=1 Tax=Gambusia affinis TaxID=33528 RepID=A0A315V8W8_GAMAF|nr:hypothetical protein CCH79_00015889 [Gambusia affinis]
MSYERPQNFNGGMRPEPWDWRAGQHQPPIDLQRELQRLSSLLEIQTARWFEENQKVAYVQRELDNTKAELQRQIRLKEMKRKLPTAEGFSSSESLGPADIASQVHSNIKHKQKMLLQQEFEQLKAAHSASKEVFVSQIRAEKAKNEALQQELNEVNEKTELQDEELEPPRRKVARRLERNGKKDTNNISDPAAMNMDKPLEETLSRDTEVNHAPPEEMKRRTRRSSRRTSGSSRRTSRT